MKNHWLLVIFLFFLVVIISGCNNEDDPDEQIEKISLNGFVQKGPFISGTNISLSELNPDLSQSGNVFNAQTTDNKGTFEVNNIELMSDFVSFRADGFYFNEIFGEPSTAQITLTAISNISDKELVNINILSHLEKPRVEYLFSEGMNFDEAKAQAQSEILQIFEIDENPGHYSELLDISKTGDENAMLLAVSAILQGFRLEAELTELLSEIRLDLKEDGTLDNAQLSSQLINHAVFLNPEETMQNLEARYNELGANAVVPAFAKYINQFVENTTFEVTETLIDYPDEGLYGPNILAWKKTDYSSARYSLAADLRKKTELKIKISVVESSGHWWYSGGSEKNWKIDRFNLSDSTQLFTAIDSDETCDLNMAFDAGEFLIEYFEMGATTPTRVKTITVE